MCFVFECGGNETESKINRNEMLVCISGEYKVCTECSIQLQSKLNAQTIDDNRNYSRIAIEPPRIRTVEMSVFPSRTTTNAIQKRCQLIYV